MKYKIRSSCAGSNIWFYYAKTLPMHLTAGYWSQVNYTGVDLKLARSIKRACAIVYSEDINFNIIAI